MSINGIYYPHFLTLSGSPNFDQVVRFDSVSEQLNYEMIQRMAGADPYPCFVGAASANPEISFTTPSVKQVLTACRDYDIVEDLTAETVELEYRKGKPQSMRTALDTAEHIKVQLVTSAMLYWTELNARESEDATISATLVTARKDVATDPVVIVGSEAASNSYCEEIYSLGPVIFNNRPLGSIHQVAWRNNIRVYSRKTANSPKDPCYQGIIDFRPVITCQTNDLEEMLFEDPAATPGKDAYGGQTMNKLQIFLRRRKRTGFYYDDNEAEHIELRCFGGWKGGTEISGNDPAEGTIEFHCSQAVSSSGQVATDYLLTKKIGIAIPNLLSTAAPSIPAISNQAATQDVPFFFQPEIGTGGLPNSDGTGWALDVSPPPGLALDTTSGIIFGTPTTPGTTPVVLTATNGNGSSPQGFDIVVS